MVWEAALHSEAGCPGPGRTIPAPPPQTCPLQTQVPHLLTEPDADSGTQPDEHYLRLVKVS